METTRIFFFTTFSDLPAIFVPYALVWHSLRRWTDTARRRVTRGKWMPHSNIYEFFFQPG
jgi:hypothetical protein